jgi:hypothetical protein
MVFAWFVCLSGLQSSVTVACFAACADSGLALACNRWQAGALKVTTGWRWLGLSLDTIKHVLMAMFCIADNDTCACRH